MAVKISEAIPGWLPGQVWGAHAEWCEHEEGRLVFLEQPLTGEPSLELKERFQYSGKTPQPPGLEKQTGQPRRVWGPSADGRRHPGLTLGGTSRGGGWEGGCGGASLAAPLCLRAPVDERGNRRWCSQRGK